MTRKRKPPLPTCDSCPYVQRLDQGEERDKIAFCHRWPPLALGDGRSSAFPVVSLGRSWCAEHPAFKT